MARRVAEALASDDPDPNERVIDDPVDDGQVQDDQIDDEGDADQQDDEGDESLAANRDDPEPRRRGARSRDDDRFAALETELRETRTRAETAERLAQEAATRYTQRQEPVETPEQEAAKLALMTPAEMVRYNQSKVEQALSRHTGVVQQMQFQAANTADKAAFEFKIAANPAWKALGAEVEKRHAAELAKGNAPTRETVLTFILGERAMKAALSPEGRRGERERQRRVDRQRTEPRGGGSDTRQDRRGGGRTAEQRLENIQI